MEISGTVYSQIPPCFSGAGNNNAYSSKLSSFPGVSFDAVNRLSGDLRLSCPRVSKFNSLRKCLGVGFSDVGHLQYYHAPARCGGGKKEKERGSSGVITTKKKLKLLKALSKDLSLFSQSDSLNALVVGDQQKIISEAADALLNQLQQLKAEEKELKRKKKLEKTKKLKATRMVESESSSSSSESSDSKYGGGGVFQMSCLRSEAKPCAQQIVEVDKAKPTLEGSGSGPKESSFQNGNIRRFQEEECCSTTSSSISSNGGNSSYIVTGGVSGKRIEVCMGGKCKKSGAAELIDEFKRVIGVEGDDAVVGCKCMGKCRDGPNVRVLNSYNNAATAAAEGVDDSVRIPTNPLCIGVGFDDVGVIVANFFGHDGGLAPAV